MWLQYLSVVVSDHRHILKIRFNKTSKTNHALKHCIFSLLGSLGWFHFTTMEEKYSDFFQVFVYYR